MTEEMLPLTRRAVACRGFRWVRGMLRHDGYRYIGSGVWARWSDTAAVVTALHMPEQYPDLTDAPTIGGLLALVREAWGCAVITSPGYDYDDEARQGPHVTGWRAVETEQWMMVGEGATEAEALVAALESAP